MVNWEGFASEAPELSALGEARFGASGLVILGTLRENGWPRVTPVEPRLVDGDLQLGMMWQSRKATDLLRDPRCTVHSTTSDKDGKEGDFKVYARAEHVTDPAIRERHCEVTERETGWRPTDDRFHVFSIDILEVGYTAFADETNPIIYAWRPGTDLRRLRPIGADETS